MRRAAALVALTVLVYLPALHAGFVWDDDLHVTQNEALRTAQGLAGIWLVPGTILQYYPLTHTAWWVAYHVWGLAPVGYHVVNVVLHGVSAAILWLVLERLGVPAAWVAAAVFAVHPVNVESVAWVTELKNVLSGVFYLLSALAFVAWSDHGRRSLYAVSLAAFVCAVLSKSVAGTLPAALAIVLWWKNGRLARRDVLALVPFVAVSGVAAVATAWMERHYVGAIGDEWALSLPERVLVAGRALWFYAAKLAWPAPLAFIYPRWTVDAHAWWQWLFPVGAAFAGAGLWFLGRAPFAAGLYFAVTLGPALGFVDLFPMRYSFVADHFQYLASIGPIALAVGAASRAVPRWVPAAAIAVLGVLSWQRTHVYATPEILWRDTLAKNPSAWMAHNNLGLVLQNDGRLDEAAAEFREAARIRPRYPEALYNLGNVLATQDRPAEAAELYERALRLDDGFAAAHNNLGNVLVMQGRVDEGKAHYRRALEINPDYPDARRNLAIADQWRPTAPP